MKASTAQKHGGKFSSTNAKSGSDGDAHAAAPHARWSVSTTTFPLAQRTPALAKAASYFSGTPVDGCPVRLALDQRDADTHRRRRPSPPGGEADRRRTHRQQDSDPSAVSGRKRRWERDEAEDSGEYARRLRRSVTRGVSAGSTDEVHSSALLSHERSLRAIDRISTFWEASAAEFLRLAERCLRVDPPVACRGVSLPAHVVDATEGVPLQAWIDMLDSSSPPIVVRSHLNAACVHFGASTAPAPLVKDMVEFIEHEIGRVETLIQQCMDEYSASSMHGMSQSSDAGAGSVVVAAAIAGANAGVGEALPVPASQQELEADGPDAVAYSAEIDKLFRAAGFLYELKAKSAAWTGETASGCYDAIAHPARGNGLRCLGPGL